MSNLSASSSAPPDLPRLPPRPREAHKGDFGRILLLAGSRGMSGAAVLCGSAALRGGAGLVRVAVPQEILPLVALGNPCYMTIPLPEDEVGCFSLAGENSWIELASNNDVVAIGPGLGRGPDLPALIQRLIEQIRVPLVLDADGLNASTRLTLQNRTRNSELILTPHPGEFARLLGTDTQTVQQDRHRLAQQFAAEQGVILLLKGYQTVITDGHRLVLNQTGNPGMATGGTGDVLTGLIAALLGQGLSGFEAAWLGAYLHGLAGDLARSAVGEVSLIASDLIHYLPEAFRSVCA